MLPFPDRHSSSEIPTAPWRSRFPAGANWRVRQNWTSSRQAPILRSGSRVSAFLRVGLSTPRAAFSVRSLRLILSGLLIRMLSSIFPPFTHYLLLFPSSSNLKEFLIFPKSFFFINIYSRGQVDVRREVTYDVFEKEIWPAIRGKKVRRAAACSTGDPFAGADPAQIAANYHPSLIWIEIISFIKGSVEALLSPTGCLERAQYLELGRKRAPNFMGIDIL